MGFDSEAVVQICVLCAEKGTHETLSIRCAMEPLLELERDTIIQYLRRTADNNGLYPALPLPPVCMSCRMEIHDPSRPVHVEMYTVRFDRESSQLRDARRDPRAALPPRSTEISPPA